MLIDLKADPYLVHQIQWKVDLDDDVDNLSGFEVAMTTSVGGNRIFTGQRLLAGDSSEVISIPAKRIYTIDGIHCFENSAVMGGYIQLPIDANNLEERTYEVYCKILRVIDDWNCFRIWNYIPNINEETPPYIENYKLFCSGRARAFIDHFGEERSEQYSSASATGCSGKIMTILFLASKNSVQHWENPEQTPAYCYPSEYGPLAPSFARASSLKIDTNRKWIFVSGTASILKSESQFEGDFTEQLRLTLKNIEITLNQSGMSMMKTDQNQFKIFKVYLKRSEHLEKLFEQLTPLLGEDDMYSVVEADICRSELEVEIELIVGRDGKCGN